jgi:hypothetical protein
MDFEWGKGEAGRIELLGANKLSFDLPLPTFSIPVEILVWDVFERRAAQVGLVERRLRLGQIQRTADWPGLQLFGVEGR